MKKTLLSLLFLLTFSLIKAQQYSISAKLTGFKNHTKFYLNDVSVDQNIDSAEIIDGNLIMKGKLSGVKHLWLTCSADKAFYFVNLLIGNDKISISGDRADFPWYLKISGSKSQDVANKLNSEIRQLWKGRDSLMNILSVHVEKPNDSTKLVRKTWIAEVNKLDQQREAITKKFINDNINSYAALEQLYYSKETYKTEELSAMFNQLTTEFKSSTHGRLLTTFLKVGKILKKGDDFHNFSASDIDGKKYSIADYKGKYILLDFTETYCGPCIESVGELKNLVNTYPDQLQIISFYAENKKEVFKQGLDRDHPTWPCIWDGKSNRSEIVMKYGVSGYPTFVLIAPDGKIADVSTGFATGSLEKMVRKALEIAK